MSEISQRYATVAARFTEVARLADPDRWDAPTPCAGWAARDVVRHIVDWAPSMLRNCADVEFGLDVAVDDDPLGAWTQLDGGLRSLLGDPGRASGEFFHEKIGRKRVDEAIAEFVLGDVLVHTWDLARAVGVDVELDPNEVRRALDRVEPKADTLSASGHYGPAVSVPDDASAQDRLLGLLGRQP